MHYLAYVVLPHSCSNKDMRRDSIERVVDRMMAPFCEQDESLYSFIDETDRFRRDYETGTTLRWIADDSFSKDTPEGDERLPHTQLYKDFRDFCLRYHEAVEENGRFGRIDNPQGIWDWFQIGGRWTGRFSDYDPTKDPDNYEVCWLCRGTGNRGDELGEKYRIENGLDKWCNACACTGRALKHPTNFKKYERDIICIKNLDLSDDKNLPYTLIGCPSETDMLESQNFDLYPSVGDDKTEFKADEERRRKEIKDRLLALQLAFPESWIVIVDYHS